jgi:hypothetical protein
LQVTSRWRWLALKASIAQVGPAIRLPGRRGRLFRPQSLQLREPAAHEA